MATTAGKSRCIKCNKEKSAVRCEGCLQIFCYDHFSIHRQELNKQLDEIELNRDLFRQTFTEQTTVPQNQSLMKQIDRWEEDSIKIIQQTANECRQSLNQHTTKHINKIEVNLAKLTEQVRHNRQENDFNEIDLRQFKEKLTQLAEKLDKATDLSIQRSSTSLVNKISVVLSSLLSPTSINVNTKWIQNGITIAGGNTQGNQLNTLLGPQGIHINDENQSIYIADGKNHRIVEWEWGAKNGRVIAGGNGRGNQDDQLSSPEDMIMDKKTDSLIICDYGNRRIVRLPRGNGTKGQTIISDIDCIGMTMDNNGDLYVSDWKTNEVRRWRKGDKNGTIVAGGNGIGDQLNQLDNPSYITVDQDYSVYVSDENNHRVMKWMKGAKAGIVVAGGQGEGNSSKQLTYPEGMTVDHLGNVYVADSNNNRIMRWLKGANEGSIVVGGNGKGNQPNQLDHPKDLSFDRQGNLYVVDYNNDRIQKFDIDPN